MLKRRCYNIKKWDYAAAQHRLQPHHHDNSPTICKALEHHNIANRVQVLVAVRTIVLCYDADPVIIHINTLYPLRA